MSSSSDDYTVGYGKPPKSGQFQKGVSGNPKGRPKKARTVSEFVAQELEKQVTVKVDGEAQVMTKAEAVAKRLVADSLSGDTTKSKVAIDKLQKMGLTGSAPTPEPANDTRPEGLNSKLAQMLGIDPAPEAEREDQHPLHDSDIIFG